MQWRVVICIVLELLDFLVYISFLILPYALEFQGCFKYNMRAGHRILEVGHSRQSKVLAGAFGGQTAYFLCVFECGFLKVVYDPPLPVCVAVS